jgi:hypothetical protein
MSTYHRRQRSDVLNALDEARFGRARILNLRENLPTVAEAVSRTESWLRERQVTGSGDVLIITGRGRGSDGGIPVVREAVLKLLGSLRRRGVIAGFADHNAGSFVVTPAPMSALFDAPRRQREPAPENATTAAAESAASLGALDADTRILLRALATRSLAALGTTLPEHYVDAEMVRQFGILAASILPGHGGEERLRSAISRALEELDDAL